MAKQAFELDSVFHALADPTRRAVVSRLASGPATISELAEPFAMALPSFMKHIGVLERSQLVTSKKVGRVRTCALDRESLIAAEIWFGEQHQLWQNRYANLDDLLTTMEGRDDEA
ncbi:metalloregulator ArsR/SmtB family transcription factor [Novosphingobium sp. BL-8A]|uniref:ArsR/SmtB family transcription factor n=1 Tax=Novosphingobium sp. BL-8A TaxID=3127639 RepID=UPI0037572A7A